MPHSADEFQLNSKSAYILKCIECTSVVIRDFKDFS